MAGFFGAQPLASNVVRIRVEPIVFIPIPESEHVTPPKEPH